jgi:lipopolysaccharide transport system ATP-binding protein
MSSNIAIKVNGLSKSYQIYEKPHDRLKQSIFPRLNQLIGRPYKQYFKEFSALKQVSFDVKRGETVGIVGSNGSGKSTLLQLICGTLNPSEGLIQINGRVVALLELGAGFNPDFTGRENVYTNGALHGFSRAEVDQKLGAILDFADIGIFSDQPVKTYSSGMFVRLAFAVAVNLNPDVLVIDEALAVGDMAFQAKCMAQIDFLKNQGVTILFVSHDLASLRNICQKVLWLKNGSAVNFGDAGKVVDAYLRDMNLDINRNLSRSTKASPSVNKEEDRRTGDASKNLAHFQSSFTPFSDAHVRYGNGEATILDVVLLDKQGNYCELLELHEPFKIRVIMLVNANIERPVIGYGFKDLKGNQVIAMQSTNMQGIEIPKFISGEVYQIEIDGVNKLTQGIYSILVAVENMVGQNTSHEYLDVVEGAKLFRSSYGVDSHNIIHGMVWDNVTMKIEKLESS